MNTKPFGVEVLLTVTTGRLLTKCTADGNGIEDLYDILGWMTGDDPFTHQLGRFAEECKPWLLHWLPELAAAGTQEQMGRLDALLDATGRNDGSCQEWIDQLGLKATYQVPCIPKGDHQRINPIEELLSVRRSG
jgi:hypothetical protein